MEDKELNDKAIELTQDPFFQKLYNLKPARNLVVEKYMHEIRMSLIKEYGDLSECDHWDSIGFVEDRKTNAGYSYCSVCFDVQIDPNEELLKDVSDYRSKLLKKAQSKADKFIKYLSEKGQSYSTIESYQHISIYSTKVLDIQIELLRPLVHIAYRANKDADLEFFHSKFNEAFDFIKEKLS